FRTAGEQILVSSGGGAQARWRRDGRELFYLDLAGRLMAVSVTHGAGGRLELGTPPALFAAPPDNGVAHQGARHHYLVSPDGQRFLVDTVVTPSTVEPITLILNWAAGP